MVNDQIITCPVCNGWGYSPLPLHGKSKPCTNCSSESTYLQNSNLNLYWDIPSYFDFSGRNRSRIVKIVFLVGVILSFLLMIYFLILAAYQTSKIL